MAKRQYFYASVQYYPMTEIPVAPMVRILKKANIDRVGDDAAVALRDVLEEYGLEVAERAARLAKHAGRVTVKAEDIRLARNR
jgi:DNA-binding protein